MSARVPSQADLRLHIWLLPAVLTAAAISLLCWGAVIYSHDPKWPTDTQAWWRPALETNQNWTLVVTMGLLMLSLSLYWWPRRRDRIPIGLVTVVVLVLVAAALGTASYVPCRSNMSTTGVTFWILQLYVGQPPSMIYSTLGPQAAACQGTPPLALQLGQINGLGATAIGALGAASVLWRKQIDRLQSRFAYDVTIFAGLNAMTISLLRRLAKDAHRPRSIIVIEPDEKNPLLEEARLTGARVVIGKPDSPTLLRPIISSLRGCALTHLYALADKVAENEAVIAQAGRILGRYKADPNRQPHLIALIDDPRHADHWRGARSSKRDVWFEDALSSAETTARGLVAQVLARHPRHILVCGDSTLTVPILVELARRAWEQAELVKALGIGLEAEPDLIPPDVPFPLPVETVTLIDSRSRDIKREYRKSAPDAILSSLPVVDSVPVQWREDLQERLDALDPARARETAVIIAESPPGSGVHEAGRVARLRPETPVFVLAASGDVTSGAIFDLLHPFEPGLLVNGEVPEDTWTRVARHWHECYRLSHPLPPGHEKAAARLPWPQLDPFLRQDNILELRSVLTAVANKCGLQWAPVHLVPQGSIVKLRENELTEVAMTEHKRWVDRRVAVGRTGENVVPWEQLSSRMRGGVIDHLRSQLSQLEAVGFVPVATVNAPPPATARKFKRGGLVRASRLTSSLTWTNYTGEEMHGEAGDWRVTDEQGNLRTVKDPEFRVSHELVADDVWRRVGTFLAWQVSEAVVVRTKEGKATARANDWIVEAPSGERWPVENGQFLWSYEEVLPSLPAVPDQASTPDAASSSTAPTISS